MTAAAGPLARRRGERRRTVARVATVLALAAVLALVVSRDRQTLWRIAEVCVADAQWTGSPFPCLEVDLSGGEADGHVIFRPSLLDDTVLIPTGKIVGVEDRHLASPGAPNYFAEAWRARSHVTASDGGTPSHDRLLLLVNSGVVRSQDELHIHIGCLKPAARRRLASVGPGLPIGEWRLIAPLAPHQPFWVLRLGRADLEGVDPFRLVFQAFGGVVDDRAKLTIGVAGATIEGKDDLVILATYVHAPGSWWPVGPESLLDSSCKPEPESDAQGAGADQGLKARRT